jgi:hypothetical protein
MMKTAEEYEAAAMLLGDKWHYSASTRTFWYKDIMGDEVHHDRDTMAPVDIGDATDRASDHWHSMTMDFAGSLAASLRGKR